MVENGIARIAVVTAVLLATLTLSGCGGGISSSPVLTAAASDDAVGRKMIGKPYKVGGKWYTPSADKDYDKTGKASWYGPKFHGGETANGEKFDQNALTAAHPTLPLPSYVRVTVLKTGKSAVLRVNDRGPFHRGRIIDVSKAASEALGFRPAGSAKVRVEYLGEAEVGGGEPERRVAEASFGLTSDRSLRDYLPTFGFGGSEDDDDDDAGEVEVRLAAATPGSMRQRIEPGPRGEPLPGVMVPQSYVPPIDEPVPTAFAEADAAAAKDGAIDALISLNGPRLEEKPVVAPKVEPLPEEVAEASQSRVMGAHDMFGAQGFGGAPAPDAATGSTAGLPDAPAAR